MGLSEYTVTGVIVASVFVTCSLLVIMTGICQLQFSDACQSPKSMQVMLGGLGIVGIIVTLTSLVLLWTRRNKAGTRKWIYWFSIVFVIAIMAFFVTASASAFDNWSCDGKNGDATILYVLAFVGGGILLVLAGLFGRMFISATKTKSQLEEIEMTSLKNDRKTKLRLQSALSQQMKMNSLMASLSSLDA